MLDNNRRVAILAVPVVASIREILVYLHAKANQQDPFPET